MNTIARQAQRAGIAMPEVAVYEGAPNAFATGATKNSVAGGGVDRPAASMTHEEIEGVLAHEVAHIANGDMVTLTLIQGVVNTFVMFLARVVAYASTASAQATRNRGPGIAFMVTSSSATCCSASWPASSWPGSRASASSAPTAARPRSWARPPMIAALRRLGGMEGGELPKNMAASGIAGRGGVMALFSSHPPIEQRIAALQVH
jgi:heat shock protein HtpX